MNLRLENPMAPEDVFDTTLICLAEISVNILRDRNKGNARRLYRIEKLAREIDALANIYEGHLPEDFIDRGEKFVKWIEKDMQSLLSGCQGEEAVTPPPCHATPTHPSKVNH